MPLSMKYQFISWLLVLLMEVSGVMDKITDLLQVTVKYYNIKFYQVDIAKFLNQTNKPNGDGHWLHR